LKEAQKGIIFAAFLKLLIPLIVVIPGIIVYVLYMQPEGTAQIPGIFEVFTKPDGSINYDNAYPWLIKVFLSPGFKGLVVAALAAAIVSSLASMLNSVATIFTMDIYLPYINKNASDKQTVNMGRITAAVALVTCVLIAPQLANVPQVFQYIQEYTGLVSPGILAVFMMGLFWKKTTTKGAIYGVLSSIVIALLLKIPALQLPFLDQMFYTLIMTIVIIAGVSLTTNPYDEDPKAIYTTSSTFKTGPAFNIGAYAILIITAVLYAIFW
ncbi:MAG: sodium/glucose cotransporter, partial [Gracilimonas sp.]